ncbi:uL30 family ribosomal protein [Candidatus Woesearchaeota archaeon]|nr:uL30 family ribosomal protein [Candidatus Woesearchaeota archaeon]
MKIAIIRVRGQVRIPGPVTHAFKLLGLNKKNHCTILEETPQLKGTLQVIEPFATWGPVDEKTLAELQKKKGKIIRLNPPRKGYGRKGVKIPFKLGGAYGNRAEKINDLIMRML